jgi:DNA topoisomerase VI subunit B
MSDVESRIALKKVDEVWNFDEAYEIDNAYKRIACKYHEFINCKEQHEKQVKFQESMLKIKLELVEDIKSWMKEEVEENESSLDTLSINDWNDISHIVECCSERLEELEREHLKTMTR